MIICITGMHRSGTSLAASWLENCGLTIHHGEVWGPSVGNPKGHFEDKDFVKLHTMAANSTYSRSKGWKVFTGDSLMFDDSHLSQAHQLLQQRKLAYKTWGWKDPRSVLFLTQWRAIIPELKVLFVWRPCLDVAQSLVMRSKKAGQAHLKITLLEAVKLWLYYNKKVCAYKRQHPDTTLLFSLNAIIDDDEGILSLLNEKFRANLCYTPLAAVFSPSLLHKRATPLALKWASSCYKTTQLEEQLQNLSDT
ncbi:MAG: hypothetical protein GY833_06785 [Aestuariibacter sp.]|nr:hypothetical protein [Aestuariibacter sp.]